MVGEFRGNVFHLVGLPLPTNQSIAEGTKCRDIAAKECQVHLEMDPGRILAGSLMSELLDCRAVLFEKGDAVTQRDLKWCERSAAAPLVKHSLGIVKAT